MERGRAVRLYCVAIAVGNVDAMNNLALSLQDGAGGIERNVKVTVGLYRRTMRWGHFGAVKKLASFSGTA